MTENKTKEIEDNVLKHTISADELKEMIETDEFIENTLPPIEIDLETYDTEEFYKGIDESSKIAGYITGLLNSGVSEEFILTYLINKDTIEYNLESLKLNNQANVEISKNQKLMLEKQEL